ncbi:MAG: bifunctional 4-hydroxy-2-oxoglutarate aldolase/2-dehydro-3-deoxy-phosphogluconate aldolase [Planctomycetota bacterium]|jgi:2-dehydro-3-deoxyphosphogluconate aldolase/(4S)-4-hydroxy-2-oxoglutarate aldolase
MQEKFETALKLRIIPVVAIHDAEHAENLADALTAGGLPCAEITFRTDAAAEAINKIAARDDVIVGAGTVLKIEQVKQAVEYGACFIVSPGFSPKVVQYCIENDIPVTPGVSTPTDIQVAHEFGLDIVKFFPAEAFGGLKTLKAMSAPYQMMKFIPTGGIGPQNVLEYLKHPKVPACGGSWMVKSNLISNQQFDEITRLSREAVELVKKASEASG